MSGSGSGIARISACVYGCLGSAKISSTVPISTIRPRYMIATRSQKNFARREVVRDVDVRQPEPRLEVDHQVEDLRPHAHVEHRDRLVGDQQIGADDDRPRDRGALLLAAGEIARVARRRTARRARGRPARASRGPSPASRRRRWSSLWICSGCASAVCERHPRVQRRVRVLEDHLQVPALRAQLALGQPGELLAAQLDAARRSGARARAARGRASSCRSRTRRPGRAPRPRAGRTRRRRRPSRSRRRGRSGASGTSRAARNGPRGRGPPSASLDATAARHASSATASASRSSGASSPAGMSSRLCSQHSERRAGPVATVGGHWLGADLHRVRAARVEAARRRRVARGPAARPGSSAAPSSRARSSSAAARASTGATAWS